MGSDVLAKELTYVGASLAPHATLTASAVAAANGHAALAKWLSAQELPNQVASPNNSFLFGLRLLDQSKGEVIRSIQGTRL